MRCSLSILLILITCTLVGQSRDVEIWNPPVGQDRFLVTFNNDFWLNTPSDVSLRPYSPGISAFIMYDYPFGKSPISFAWGYGFSSHNVHHDGYFAQDSTVSGSFTALLPHSDGYTFKKNKLSSNYVEIPLELRLRTKGENQFKLYLGGKVGYAVNVHSKTIDDDGKRKFYGVENMMPLRYGVSGTIGYNGIALSGFYSLSPMFEEGKGIDLIPISIGLTFFLL
ncbi:MAG: PorT family protein [Flavobacteriales bacterium]|nr:PorT family protein [Flavobacteriales bacterium]